MLIVAFVVGCIDSPAAPIAAESHVFAFDHPGWWPRTLDILFAIDDAPALVPYLDRVRALPAGLVVALSHSIGGLPDLQVGVVTPARGLTDVLVDTQNVDGTRTPNYAGTLVDALTARVDVGATSGASPRLLEAMQVALAHPGFVRPRGGLIVITISARDDASPREPGEYALYLSAAKSSQWSTHAVGIYPVGAAPRLDTFHRGTQADATSIDVADYTEAFDFLGNYIGLSLGSPCIPEPADRDPDTAGAQYDCAMSWLDEDGREYLLPACSATSSTPCWELEPDPQNCIDDVRVKVRGYADPFRPTVRGQCIVD